MSTRRRGRTFRSAESEAIPQGNFLEPDTDAIIDGAALRAVRGAFQARADAERELAEAVAGARGEGHSWAAIGAMLGTSGEAARQRHGRPATRR